MAKVQHNKATAASILQIGFSRNTKCANKDSFRRDTHIYNFTGAHIYIHMHTHIHTYTHAHVCTHMCARTHTHSNKSF